MGAMGMREVRDTAIPSATLRTGLAVFPRAGSPCHDGAGLTS